MRPFLFAIPLAGALVAFGPPAPTLADDAMPTPAELAASITHALDPTGSMMRSLEIDVRGPDGKIVTWQGKQLRKSDASGRKVLTVLTDPPSVGGFAVLVTERSESNDTYWMYVPAVRRVRKLIHEGRYENFLGTDLSAGDVGFLRISPSSMKVIGKETRDGAETWHVEEHPEQWSGYSRIETWVATASGLPIRREYYDSDGRLWKVETRSDIQTFGGRTVPMVLTVKDVQDGGETTVKYSDVRADVKLDDSLFTTEALPAATAKTASPG